MALRINQNIAAMNAYRNLSVTDGQISKSLEKLSSGLRINRAADDAAGLAISEGLRSQVGGLKVANRNAQDGISVVQTAEGALNESQAILQRMRDLAVQSSTDSNDQTSRDALNAEATALKDELTRIADKTTFNNVNLLDGSFTGKEIQVGYAANDVIDVDIVATAPKGAKMEWDNGSAAVTTAGAITFTVGSATASVTFGATETNANDIVTTLNADDDFKASFTAKVTETGGLEIKAKDASIAGSITVGGAGVLSAATTSTAAAAGTGGFDATDLGVGGVDLSTKAGAQSSIEDIDTAIKAVSTARGALGALQNRFEHTINNLNVAVENLSASESRIRDVDMAQEMVSFTKSQILSQAGTSMLAQANQAPQSVMSLLR